MPKKILNAQVLKNNFENWFDEKTKILTMFYGYTKIEALEFGALSINNANETPIKKIFLPKNFTSIDKNAFSNSKVEKINILPNVKSIGKNTILNCWMLKQITMGFMRAFLIPMMIGSLRMS